MKRPGEEGKKQTDAREVVKTARLEEAKRRARLRRGIDKMLKDDDGREVLKYLHDICGWNKSGVVVTAVGIDTQATTYNECRRDIYRRLRALATRTLLTPVEEEAESQQGLAAEEDTKESTHA